MHTNDDAITTNEINGRILEQWCTKFHVTPGTWITLNYL